MKCSKCFPKFILAVFVVGLGFDVHAANLPVLGCLLEPSKRVAISSPVAGVIDEIPLERGSVVEQGQLLFRLRSEVQTAAVDLARVKVGFAERTSQRNAELFEDDLLSSYERDEIETEHLLAEMELKVAVEELNMRTVSSPATGVVVDKYSDVGEYVSTDPVLEIAALDPLHAEVLLPYERFREFSVGDEMTIVLAAPLAGSYKATISIIDPVIDSGSGTFRLRLEVPNQGFSIPAGVTCQLGP